MTCQKCSTLSLDHTGLSYIEQLLRVTFGITTDLICVHAAGETVSLNERALKKVHLRRRPAPRQHHLSHP
jgi:hypothetical protein